MEEHSLFALIAREVTRLNARPYAQDRGHLMSRRAARKANPLASIPDTSRVLLRKAAAFFKATQ
jgi:hypothetical protein